MASGHAGPASADLRKATECFLPLTGGYEISLAHGRRHGFCVGQESPGEGGKNPLAGLSAAITAREVRFAANFVGLAERPSPLLRTSVVCQASVMVDAGCICCGLNPCRWN